MARFLETRGGGLLLAAAVVVEGVAWATSGGNRTETFAWFRVQDRLGVGGFLVALGLGLLTAAAMNWWRRRPEARVPAGSGRGLPVEAQWALAVGVALLIHAPMFHVAQGHLDTIRWFTDAQAVARGDWRGERLVALVQGAVFSIFGETTLAIDVTLTAWAVALAVAAAWGGAALDEGGRWKPAWLAAAIVSTTPLLWAQSGWLLADLPLVALLALAWGAARRAAAAGTPGTVALAVVTALAACAAKNGAFLFLAATLTLFARNRPRTVLVGVAVLTLAALRMHAPLLPGFTLSPPRLRPLSADAAAELAMTLHLRPSLWVTALVTGSIAWKKRAGEALTSDFWLLAGSLAAAAALAFWAPPEHAARYALPALVPLAWWVASRAPALAAFAVGSAVVLGLAGYRPIVAHSQAENLREAVVALEASGATAIEVMADMPRSTLGVESVAALVDLDANVPVRTGTQVGIAAPANKYHWWEHLSSPPWRESGPADAILLACAGGDCAEPDPVAWREVCDIDAERGSSLLLPSRVRGFRRK